MNGRRRDADRVIGRYRLDDGHAEVREARGRRTLWFDDGVLQSEIDLAQPGVLPNPANRAMLAHLMFTDVPQRVLLAGCGGGGIARWFAERAGDAGGIAVEISPAVVDIARTRFDFPAPGGSWELVTGDVRDYLDQAGPRFDFILFDIAVAGFTPAWVTADETLRRARSRLTPAGVATFNLLPRSADDLSGMLMRLRSRFDRRTLCLGVPNHDNVVTMAFNRHPPTTDLAQRAAAAKVRWGIEFDTLLTHLRHQNPPGSGIF